MNDIVIESVSVTFHHRDGTPFGALQDVSFSVPRGSLVCIVGPSGCGKSTLLKLLIGMLEPTSGRAWIDPARRAEGIAYIQQGTYLLPWRTLSQNAALGVEIRNDLNEPSLDRIRDEIRAFGLERFEHAYAEELSGGMKQRVELIRAVESRPAVLLCDEPFSAIDFVTRLELNTRFKKMCRIYGISTLLVTHNIEEALFLGDTVLVMSGRPGRIVGVHQPKFSSGGEDAVKCREAPEFAQLFNDVWEELGEWHIHV